MYRIAWRSKLTSLTGFGSTKFTREQAKKIANKLNEEKGATCTHWAELAPTGETKPKE